MKTVIRTLRFTMGSMALSMLLPWSNASMGDTPTGGAATEAPAPVPYSDVLRELQAAGPHPSLGSGAEVLGRFVGTWAVEYSFFSKGGKVTHKSGEYLAGWVMDGRAIQDIWIVDPSGERKDREIYTSLHYFDPKSGTLYLTFIDPENASPDHEPVARFTGAAEGDGRVVILTHDLGGKDGDKEDRWSFSDIGPDSFVFRDEQSSDGGKTWRILEEDHMTRRGANQAAM